MQAQVVRAINVNVSHGFSGILMFGACRSLLRKRQAVDDILKPLPR
jgi:hypothetical protein